MTPRASYACLLMLCPLALPAQSPRSVAADAFMVIRMAEKFHTQPRPLDAAFSAGFFDAFVRNLDGEHFLFLQGDFARLEPFRQKLVDQVSNQRTDFLDLATAIYGQRIHQADSLVDQIASVPMKLNLPSLGKTHATPSPAADDTTPPLNLTGMKTRLTTLMREAEMSYVQRDLDSGWRDTEVAERRRVKDMVKRNIRGMTQRPGGLVQALDLVYCNALAGSFDPHTEFFSTTEKEQFEQELGNRRFVFGFAMKEQGKGVVIDRIQPGSPAFKTGVFSKGDQLTSVQWAGKEPIDLTDASMDEINDILDASNHDEATFVVKKADGTVRQVSLNKEEAPEEGLEENRVKGWVLKGAQNIGYISLPSFYTDWDSRSGEEKGCAEDVAKEILELKKEHITGLILDLRYNGGGSLQEAIDLAGLFIDAGPLAQARDRDAKPYVLRDMNRGTVFDGPLILLVNGYSASASEVIAGSLQDYNRALIVGTPTYGKASAQVILPLDTNISLQDAASVKPTGSFLKLTVSRLYRVTGASIQATGVQPDILLPVPEGAEFRREADAPFALQPTTVDPNKYFRPYPPIAKDQLRQFVSGLGTTPASTFTMASPADEQRWIAADPVLKTVDEQIRGILQADPYMEVAFRVACQMQKSPN